MYTGFPGGSTVVSSSEMQVTRVQYLDQEDSLDKRMATHSIYMCIYIWLHHWVFAVHRLSLGCGKWGYLLRKGWLLIAVVSPYALREHRL